MRLLICSFLILICTSLSLQEIPSLTAKQIDSFKTLTQNRVITYTKGAEEMVYIDPDIWGVMGFQQRKTFTENLCVYQNRYIQKDMDWQSWWIEIRHAGTRKKIAQWKPLTGYKEF